MLLRNVLMGVQLNIFNLKIFKEFFLEKTNIKVNIKIYLKMQKFICRAINSNKGIF